MSGDDFSQRASSQPARESVEQCLRLVMALKPTDLADPQTRTGLMTIVDTLKVLLSRHSVSETPTPPDTSCGSVEPDVKSTTWRTRVKSDAEKQEKKARLEKREAILRDLRSRVTEFKTANDGIDLSASAMGSSHITVETFEARVQRASFWPEGSVEWARQLLGIEMAMTTFEKRQRYLEMVKMCHPDHNRHVSPDVIQQVNAAWDVLNQ